MTEGVHVDVFDRNNYLSDVMPDRAVIPFVARSCQIILLSYVSRIITSARSDPKRKEMFRTSLINPAVAVEIYRDRRAYNLEPGQTQSGSGNGDIDMVNLKETRRAHRRTDPDKFKRAANHWISKSIRIPHLKLEMLHEAHEGRTWRKAIRKMLSSRQSWHQFCQITRITWQQKRIAGARTDASCQNMAIWHITGCIVLATNEVFAHITLSAYSTCAHSRRAWGRRREQPDEWS
ncbi:hypothetical protein B0H14DRAFT_2591721 [Mycena olivaceomarginata]|nr:hypothetical protein B0H14DRAFT_2591721 [Mycena olivaceomarginata]